jgi:hypothetical protein
MIPKRLIRKVFEHRIQMRAEVTDVILEYGLIRTSSLAYQKMHAFVETTTDE